MPDTPHRTWMTGLRAAAGLMVLAAYGGTALQAAPGAPPPAALAATTSEKAPNASNPLNYDPSRYMAPNEIQRGMKGYGRTVMAGTEIETFQLEVISVLKNAFEPRQDVILVRCSGLNLEQSGIAHGMSGSPCYIRDGAGRERMIGAVAFGWSFSKEPICGVQPITQMLGIPDARKPENRPKPPVPGSQPADGAGSAPSQGYPLGELMARAHPEPIDSRSRLSAFNEDIIRAVKPTRPSPPGPRGLEPLPIPIMVSGASGRARQWMQERFDHLGLAFVASGAAGAADKAAGENVKLEPGSVLAVQLMTGDMNMEGIGTCTEVVGDKVLGFGHQMFAAGYTELPLATGMIHTLFPSVLSSFKIGASLKTVGTLWGDEKTGVFGIRGATPAMADLKVTVKDAFRGRQVFKYQMARDPSFGAMLLASGAAAAIYCHNELPPDHALKYRVRIDFENAGTYETSNFTSAIGVYGLAEDLLFPAMMMYDTPFGDAKISSAVVDAEIEPVTRSADIDRLRLAKLTCKPGETMAVGIRWHHLRSEPAYTEATYDLTIPSDLPDGEYTLTVGSAGMNLVALRTEKPHRFRVESLRDIVETLNLATSFPQNRLYMRLEMPEGGLAVGRQELPDLPSYRRKILLDSMRNDVGEFIDALVVTHDTDFVVNGRQSVTLKVSRKTEY